MAWMVVKPLRQSELGWFEACRIDGRETGRQRGLNIDAHIVQGLMKPGADQTVIDVTTVWSDGERRHEDSRTIRKQRKNWRLTGQKVPGVRFADVAPDDPIVLLFERDGGAWRVTWDVVTRAASLAVLRERCLELLDGQSSRLLAPQEAGPMLKMVAEDLPSFRAEGVARLSDAARLPERGAVKPRVDREPLTLALPLPTTQKDITNREGTREPLPPDARSFISALRSVGYRFEEAVGDLIDNSIQAGASAVVVRLVERSGSLIRVMIADDGSGMTGDRLREAFRLGIATEHQLDSLSKFGMGMKLASISQCKSLTVVSDAGARSPAGRRWTVSGMANNWQCEELSTHEVRALRGTLLTRLPGWKTRGTLVVWDDLDRIPQQQGVGSHAVEIRKQLSVHLGLHFHRFLAGKVVKPLRILLEIQEDGEEETTHSAPVAALDPFRYPRSGSTAFPRDYTVQPAGLPSFRVTAHVWPARVDLPEFELDGAARRQGFYLYRNQRLIVAGGWLGVKQAAKSNALHARIAVDVKPELDHLFQLDIRKVHLAPPPGFERAVLDAQDEGPEPSRTFRQYLEDARVQARTAEGPSVAGLPVVLGEGLPMPVRRVAKEGLDAVYEIRFEWANLEDDDTFFSVNLPEQIVYLNSRWRKVTNGKRNASATDAVLNKSLLFFSLKDFLGRSRTSAAWKERIAEMNRILVAAARYLERA